MSKAYNSGVLGNAIAEAVDKKGWRQADLAAALGMYQQTVSKWIIGDSIPKLPTLLKIEEALDLPRGKLVKLIMPEAGKAVKNWHAPKTVADRLSALETRFQRIEELVEYLADGRVKK